VNLHPLITADYQRAPPNAQSAGESPIDRQAVEWIQSGKRGI
jgi:hypothetical protein